MEPQRDATDDKSMEEVTDIEEAPARNTSQRSDVGISEIYEHLSDIEVDEDNSELAPAGLPARGQRVITACH